MTKLEAGQRMGRHDVDPLGDAQPRRIGGHHEGRDALGAGRGAGARKHAIEVGNARRWKSTSCIRRAPNRAVADRARGHRRDVRSRVGLRQREGRDRVAAAPPRQPAPLLLVASGQRDRAAAKALHREREVGQPIGIRKRLAGHAQRPRIERRQRAAVRGGHAVAQPARRAQRLHVRRGSGIDVVRRRPA